MSYQSVSLIDPTMRWIESEVRGSKVGYKSVARNDFLPSQTAFPAGSSVDWTINCSQPVVGSAPLVSCEMTVVFNGMSNVDNATVLGQSGSCVFGFHSFPINRLFSNLTVTLNGAASTVTRPSEQLDALANSMSQEELLQISPYSAPDVHHSYDTGSIADPLTHPMDSLGWTRHWRSAQVMQLTPDSGAQTLAIKLRIVERLCAHPFQWAHKSPSPFVGLKTIEARGTLAGDLSQCLGISSLPAGASFGSLTINRMSMMVDQFTPHDAIKLPTKAFYPFFRANKVDANGGAVTIAAGASNLFVVPSAAYNAIPKLVVIRAYETNRNRNRPSRNYPITKVELSINGSQRRFQSLSQHQLYQLARKNGYSLSFQCFVGEFDAYRGTVNGNTGCVLYLLPSDMDTPDFTQSNVAMSTTVEAQVTVSNPTNANANIQCEVMVVEDQVLSVQNGVYTATSAYVTSGDLVEGKVQYIAEDDLAPEYLGGSFLSWIKNAGKTLGRVAKKIVTNPVAKKAINFARNNIPGVNEYVGDNTTAGKFLKSQGYGLVDTRGQGIVNVAGSKMKQSDLMALLE